METLSDIDFSCKIDMQCKGVFHHVYLLYFYEHHYIDFIDHNNNFFSLPAFANRETMVVTALSIRRQNDRLRSTFLIWHQSLDKRKMSSMEYDWNLVSKAWRTWRNISTKDGESKSNTPYS